VNVGVRVKVTVAAEPDVELPIENVEVIGEAETAVVGSVGSSELLENVALEVVSTASTHIRLP
jgi:hypothetical protein